MILIPTPLKPTPNEPSIEVSEKTMCIRNFTFLERKKSIRARIFYLRKHEIKIYQMLFDFR